MSRQSDDHSTANMKLSGHFYLGGKRRNGALYYVESSGMLFRMVHEDGKWRAEQCPNRQGKPVFEVVDVDLVNKLVAFLLLSLAAAKDG